MAKKRFFLPAGFCVLLYFVSAVFPPSLYPYTGEGIFPPENFIESAEVRKAVSAKWLEDEISRVSILKPETVQDSLASEYEFSCSLSVDSSSLITKVNPADADGIQGEWRLYRSMATGQAEEIRIFPLNDENVFVSVYPPPAPQKKTFLSIEIYGSKLCDNIPVGGSFESLYHMPLSRIYEMTDTLAPWYIFSHNNSDYNDIISVVHSIQTLLPRLVYTEDGAFDENGKAVHIKDLSPQAEEETWGKDIIGGVNCSGFAKWIVDGIIRPAAGNGLFIQPLKTPTDNPDSHFTKPHREQRDLFFGLDWCRNLAAAVVTLNAGKTVLPAESGTDVTDSVFADGTGYSRHTGYPVEELIPLLYYLAVKEPGCFYLGAVNRLRGNPPLRQYHHIAVFFPYFSAENGFCITVFESAAETDKQVFIERNKDAFIHLSRVKVPEAGRFILQNE